ncbi:MAG: hypothetical protein QM758_02315 [Armatimonas sp.]
MRKVSIIALALSAAISLSGAAFAQGGNRANRQNRQEKRQNQILAGRIVQGVLKNTTFGDNATVTLEVPDLGTIVAKCAVGVQFHQGMTGSTLTSFAINTMNQTVTAELVKSQGVWSLREMWDSTNWQKFLQRHEGIKSGGIVSQTNRVLQLSGDLRYGLSKDTRWVKGMQNSNPEAFNARDTVYVKSEVKDNVPVAIIVADTMAGAESTALDTAQPGGDIPKRPFPGNNRPKKGEGMSERPASSGSSSGSTGNTRPPSTGSSQSASAYKIRMFLKVTDSSDNATEGVAGAYGQAAKLVGLTDKKVECFGEMRANGQLIWQIKREDSKNYQRQAGQTITILPPANSPYRDGSNWVWNSGQLSLTGALKDDDNLTSDDMLYQWTLNLDLATLAGQGEKTYKSAGGKAELHIVVTR